MLTRCPACATHFRVTPDQLKLRSGRVRCGECQHVFNALDTLIEEPPIVIASAPAAEPPPPTASTLTTAEPGQAAEIAVAPAPTLDPIPAPDENAPDATSSEMAAPDASEFTTGEPPPADKFHAATDATVVDIAVPALDQEQIEAWEDVLDEPAPPRRWPWLLGSLCALVALGVQAAVVYRIELAVLWPEIKPALVGACQTLGCEVGLPAKVTLIGIEASDLHPDSAQKGRLTLTATLKNRAPFAQQFPNIELTLTDTADKAIVRKVLAPADYLPRNTPFASGMAPNVDVAINIGLDAGELPASGYRLYIFYP